MKQITVFRNYVMILFAGVLIASCSKKKDDPIPADPKLLTFGFYADDNEGVIVQDYEVTAVTGTAISIALPKEVDKTKLVARFTLTDRATITVGGAPQQSGVTQQNFSVPVDYIVSEEQVNVRYTVTVVKAADYVWSRVSSFTADSTNGFVMKVNPTTGVPYFAYKGDRIASADEKAFVVKYENGTWAHVGSAQGISDGQIGGNIDIAFGTGNNLYVTYPDYTVTPAQSATVQQFNGSAWSFLGSKGLTGVKVTYGVVGLNPATQQPVLVNTMDAAGTLVRRALGVSLYNGTSWSANNTITGRDAAAFGSLQVAKNVGDALYLGVFNYGGTQTYSVYKFKNNVWEVIADKMLEPGATNSNLRDFDMDVDVNGNIYIAISDDAQVNGTYNLRIKKYDATAKTWSQVGSVFPLNINTTRYFSLAVSPTGLPYVLYRNEQTQAEVAAFDTETRDWVTPKVLESVKMNGTTDVALDFSPDGVGYAAFVNEAGRIVLHKLDVPAN